MCRSRSRASHSSKYLIDNPRSTAYFNPQMHITYFISLMPDDVEKNSIAPDKLSNLRFPIDACDQMYNEQQKKKKQPAQLLGK